MKTFLYFWLFIIYGVFYTYSFWRKRPDPIMGGFFGFIPISISLMIFIFSFISMDKVGLNPIVYLFEENVWSGLLCISIGLFANYIGLSYIKKTKKTWTILVLFPIILGIMMLLGYFKIWGGYLPPVDLRKIN
ncbi:hypothetical protein ACFSX9_09060 [Flavobacterium ardleyense]|uniref:Uncharacterized protein n=1 Tax=Flavobacterium ardleyense TaxID=2038737 RepID=A0ABW5Z9D1_9FLAO